jgi:hypothetical protein
VGMMAIVFKNESSTAAVDGNALMNCSRVVASRPLVAGRSFELRSHQAADAGFG